MSYRGILVQDLIGKNFSFTQGGKWLRHLKYLNLFSIVLLLLFAINIYYTILTFYPLRPISVPYGDLHVSMTNTLMTNPSRLHNKHRLIVRNASHYLSNTTIRRDLNAATFRKKVVDLSKKIYSNLYNLSNEILAEVQKYDVCESDHRKRPKFSNIINVEGP